MAIEQRMLVVDDEAIILEEMIEVFEGRGFHCRGATGADQALALIREDPEITLIVTDVKMPGKSGMDLIIEARRIPDRRIVFIVATGHGGTTQIGDPPVMSSPRLASQVQARFAHHF